MDRCIPGGTWWLLNGSSCVEPGMVSGVDPIPAMAAMPQWEPDPCSWPREHAKASPFARVSTAYSAGPDLVGIRSIPPSPFHRCDRQRDGLRRSPTSTRIAPPSGTGQHTRLGGRGRQQPPGHRVEQDTCRNRVPALLSARTYEMVSERTEVSRSATSAQFTMFHRAVT
jgi:hypothetical protein